MDCSRSTLVRRAIGPPSAWNVDGPLPDPGVLSYQPSTPAIAFGSGGEIHMVLAGFALGVLYAYYDGCTWTPQPVDTDITQGGYGLPGDGAIAAVREAIARMIPATKRR